MKNKTILFFIFLISIGLWVLFSQSHLISSLNGVEISTLYTSIHSLSLTLFGILLAILALFTSLVNHSFVSKMQKTGHFKVLIKSIFWNSFSFLCLICLTFIKPFLETELSILILKISLIILSISFLLLLDIGKKFWFLFCGLNQQA